MPPFLMMIGIAFVVLLVMLGDNPMDQWRAEQAKYGKDPLIRSINKFNEEGDEMLGRGTKYKPPPGAMVYRLPPGEAPPPKRKNPFAEQGSDGVVYPAPDLPMTQWGNTSYPSYMLAPQSPGGTAASQGRVVLPNNSEGVAGGARNGSGLSPGFQ